MNLKFAAGWAGWAIPVGAAVLALLRPTWAAAAALAGPLLAAWPLIRAWRGAEGTALRPAVAWAALAVTLGAAGLGVGLGEDPATGRPGLGHWSYLSALATLAALISVLNARTPGGGAWAILMGLLVLVFLLPWLEGPGLARTEPGWHRLRLGAPWTLFFGLLVLAGVTNHLPTRFGAASAWLGLGLGLVYLALTRTDWPVARRGMAWWALPLIQGAAAWSVLGRAEEPPAAAALDRLWAWFRDRWGVVWALRVQERFQRAAEASGWPIRLGWHGPERAGDPPASAAAEAAAAATLAGLLRRFADPATLERVSAGAGDGDGRPCPDRPAPG